jgi:hypothetical protein
MFSTTLARFNLFIKGNDKDVFFYDTGKMHEKILSKEFP